MTRRSIAGLVMAALLAAAPAAAAPNDGFAAFWKGFAAAVARDDQTALASMTIVGPGLDDQASFAAFHAADLKPSQRRCLARARPVRDVDGQGEANYSAQCGAWVYVFYKRAGAWKLTDVGAGD